MANNNVKNIQFLRNGTLYGTREAAIAAFDTQKANVADGSIIFARYSGETADDVKTLAGLVYVNGETRTVTIIDVEGASGDVETLREEINAKLGTGVTSSNTATAQLAALSGNAQSTSADTSVEGAKKYADAKISELDYTDTAVAGQYVSQVTEADGKIAVTRADVSSAGLNNYSKGSDATAVAATDTINQAISKLENQIDAAEKAATDAIEALDYTDTAATGEYVSAVNEANGVISVTRVALPTVAAITEAGKPIVAVSENLGTIAASAGTIDAQYVDVTDSGNLFSATTVEGVLAEIDAAYKAADRAIVGDATTSGDTLGKLEDRIEALDADAKEYQLSAITESLPETVKERYALVDGDGKISGTTIDIPKDSHIVSITYDGTTQKLTYTYLDASGNTQSTDVDMSELVLETEFGSGVTVTDHVAHGVVDSTSETFLTVGANGFKLSGVQDAIDNAIGALDNTSDAAVAGQYITHITENDGIISAGGRANISEAVLNNYASGSSSGAVASTDTINEAFGKVENQIAAINNVVEDLDASVYGGTTAGTATADHIQVIVDEVNGKLTAVTVTETNIADADDLAELSGKTVTEVGSSNSSISATTAATSNGTVSVDLVTDASKIQMSGFTSTDALSGITSSSSITEAFEEVDAVITANEQVVSAALNDLEATKVETIVVNGVTGTTTSGANPTASVTIDGNDVVLGPDYTKPAQGSAIATGDTVDAALGKLEARVDAATSGGITGATVNSAPLAITNNVLAQTVVGKQSEATATTNEAIVVETDEHGNLTLGLANLDAGTY